MCQERYRIYGRRVKVDQQSSSDLPRDLPGVSPGDSSSDKRRGHPSAASEPEKLDNQSQTTIEECEPGPEPKR